MKAWLDGKLVDDQSARVSAFDHGFTVGDGVFETMRVVEGQPFALTRHLARLTRSANALGLSHPDEAQIRESISRVLGANRKEDVGRLRITVTGGTGPLGTARNASPATVFIACSAATVWPASTALATVPWRRNERSAVAGVKTTSYAENVVALRYAHDQGASEALFLNTVGQVCEGTGSNIFIVRDGALVTPPLSSGCLAGVTRELLLEWCNAIEAPLTEADLAGTSEIALTSSTRDVHPVHSIDGRAIAAPGPVTAAAMAVFASEAARSNDP